MGLLTLAALGVVYGDIGTSPLYALRECFHGVHPVAVLPANIFGVLSLIFWALILIISIKYVVFILRADYRGEGGILALAKLVTPQEPKASRRRWIVVTLGLFGAALLYADGMITPAISVLSAVEGLKIATPFFEPYIIPITITILVVLFFVQSHGTARVGAVFGPVILLWFTTLGALGTWHIVQEPSVLQAINPLYGFQFFQQNGWAGFLILGTVFLVVTGGEALYADLGHFGARPIRLAWFAVVLPGLLLNYFGQGAFLMEHPAGYINPFYRMAPEWMLYPLVGLATAAAVIASQALITGAFSLTLQAVQLGFVPRMTIAHTSHEQIGQIYIPVVNWTLMVACIALVLGFGSSSNLAAVYGVDITMTMVITTLLFFELMRIQWHRHLLPVAVVVAGFFLVIDLAFFGANLFKIPAGGWFPLLVASAIYTLMATWRRGREVLGTRLRKRMIPLELFLAELLSDPPHRVPGTAVFMSGNPIGTPPALRHNVMHNKILHERVIILNIETADVPHVPVRDRSEVEQVGEGFWRITLTYGFMDEPHVPRSLARIECPVVDVPAGQVSFFLGRETILPNKEHPGMALWRERLFTWMSRNSQTATHFFHLPPERVVEVGVQVEL